MHTLVAWAFLLALTPFAVGITILAARHVHRAFSAGPAATSQAPHDLP